MPEEEEFKINPEFLQNILMRKNFYEMNPHLIRHVCGRDPDDNTGKYRHFNDEFDRFLCMERREPLPPKVTSMMHEIFSGLVNKKDTAQSEQQEAQATTSNASKASKSDDEDEEMPFESCAASKGYLTDSQNTKKALVQANKKLRKDCLNLLRRKPKAFDENSENQENSPSVKTSKRNKV